MLITKNESSGNKGGVSTVMQTLKKGSFLPSKFEKIKFILARGKSGFKEQSLFYEGVFKSIRTRLYKSPMEKLSP